MSAYTNQKINFNIVKKYEFPVNFINLVFYNLAKSSKLHMQSVGHSVFVKKQNLIKNNGYGYIYVENHNKDKIVFFNMTLLHKKNIKTVWPFQSDSPSLILNPLRKDIIIYESLSESYTSQISYGFLVKSYDL